LRFLLVQSPVYARAAGIRGACCSVAGVVWPGLVDPGPGVTACPQHVPEYREAAAERAAQPGVTLSDRDTGPRGGLVAGFAKVRDL